MLPIRSLAVLALSCSLTAQSGHRLAHRGFHLECPVDPRQNVQVVNPVTQQAFNTLTAPPRTVFQIPIIKPLAQGRVMALLRGSAPRTLAILAPDSTVEWRYSPAEGRQLHHDFHPMQNGNVMLLCRETARSPALGNAAVQDDVFVEIDPQGNMLWQWSTLQNIDKLPITPAEWATIVPHLNNVPTVFHANSVQPLPPNQHAATDPRFTPGNLLVSFRDINVVCIIERSTGDVVWSLRDRTQGQHHAKMIPQGLRGAGNIMIFDNGAAFGIPVLPARNRSRIVEIDPISQQTVWQYAPRTGFYSQWMGSAQRLANGNTLVCEATRGRMFEIDAATRIVWQRQFRGSVYRAYRADPNWLQGAPYFWW